MVITKALEFSSHMGKDMNAEFFWRMYAIRGFDEQGDQPDSFLCVGKAMSLKKKKCFNIINVWCFSAHPCSDEHWGGTSCFLHCRGRESSMARWFHKYKDAYLAGSVGISVMPWMFLLLQKPLCFISWQFLAVKVKPGEAVGGVGV